MLERIDQYLFFIQFLILDFFIVQLGLINSEYELLNIGIYIFASICFIILLIHTFILRKEYQKTSKFRLTIFTDILLITVYLGAIAISKDTPPFVESIIPICAIDIIRGIINIKNKSYIKQ